MIVDNDIVNIKHKKWFLLIIWNLNIRIRFIFQSQ